MFLATSQARAILKRSVELSDFVWQTANLAGFISGCYTDDLDMIRASLEDVVIEPQRQALIPGFHEVRRGAMEAGASAARFPAPGLDVRLGPRRRPRRCSRRCAAHSGATPWQPMGGSWRCDRRGATDRMSAR